MLKVDESSDRRLRTDAIDADLVVVGGGIAGTCAAITAARRGLQVVLLQDRPVLGGNASSEVRLWVVGATSHMGNNNRWAREGGVINEILIENAYRNPEGNPILFDTVLLEKATAEPTLKLLLNAAVFQVGTGEDGAVESVTAFCSQNSTKYVLKAPLFCDASGDGIVGFLAGAAFRVGMEAQSEFGELLAPASSRRELLGHSIYFYTRDVGRPVEYVPPSYKLDDIRKIPRYRRFNTKEQGTDLWWIEYGGSLDTIHETESIKWELWKIIYGVWDYIKNSGEFPDAQTLTLDWVGLIPGKRESRRFEGDYMLVQQDVVEQRMHDDAVSFGGWAIDHHPVDNIYSGEQPCTQWHCKGVYQIPYRTMYSRNVPNLFLCGRIISASHVAFGSSRVMATCGHNGQAVGMAAALCCERNLKPRDLTRKEHIRELQLRLLRAGQNIPHVRREDPADLAQQATVTATSSLRRLELMPTRPRQLVDSRALLVPVVAGRVPEITLFARHAQQTELVTELRSCSRNASFTPDITLAQSAVILHSADAELTVANGEHDRVARPAAVARSLIGAGVASKMASAAGYREDRRHAGSADNSTDVELKLRFDVELPGSCYAFVCLKANDLVDVYESEHLVTGITTVRHVQNAKVARSNEQVPPIGSGIDRFEFWPAERRPRGRNLAAMANLSPATFAPDNVINGFQRPTTRPNAWVAAPSDRTPTLTLHWAETKQIQTIELVFDADWDHPMETVGMSHRERFMPTVVRNFWILGANDEVLVEYRGNYQAEVRCRLNSLLISDRLSIKLEHPSELAPASIYEVRCYAE